MRRSDWVVVGTVAVVTAACAMLLFDLTRVAVAETGSGEPAKPTLCVNGVELTLAAGKTAYSPGEEPTLTLRAVNTGNRCVELPVVVRMTTTEPTSPFARRMPLPRQVWQEECDVVLDEGQCRVYDLSTGVSCKAGKVVSIQIEAGGQIVAALTLAVGGSQQANGGKALLLPLGQQTFPNLPK